MPDCIFCGIVAGEIPAGVVYRDENILAFEDIAPKAPVHILIIPKEHISTLDECDGGHEKLLGQMMLSAAELARERGIAESGYRVLLNCNRDGGQEVFHVHVHLLGGRKLGQMG